MSFSKIDYQMMTLAISLAKKGKYHTQPNPMVGCVITDDKDNILATGYHKYYGGDHAEIVALKNLNNNKECTMYVSLEPCCFHNKTPACTKAIIKSNIKRVVIATLDVNPKVAGKGVLELKKHNINVSYGLLATQAADINREFIDAHTNKTPFIRAKIAMSIDGKTATEDGQSKWITNEYARDDVQKLRAKADAILTGSGTVIADNPYMTVRFKKVSRPPIRLVIDSQNIINKSANIFNNTAPTRHYTKDNTQLDKNGKINLKALLQQLYNDNINHILLEAGATLTGLMLEQKLIDEIIIYTAPTIMGSNARSAFNINIDSLDKTIKLNIKSIRLIGDNIKIIATPQY